MKESTVLNFMIVSWTIFFNLLKFKRKISEHDHIFPTDILNEVN